MATQVLSTDTTSTSVAATTPAVTPLSINYINPNIVVRGRVNVLTIQGTGFQNDASVMIGGIALSTTTSNFSANTISVNFPNQLPGPLPAGLYAITITNPDGATATLPNAFTITESQESPSQPTIINNDMTSNATQDIEELQDQYAQDLGIIQNTPGGLSEEQGEENALNQLYNLELQAARLGAPCFSPNLTLAGGEQGAEALQGAMDCAASTPNE